MKVDLWQEGWDQDATDRAFFDAILVEFQCAAIGGAFAVALLVFVNAVCRL